MYRLVLYGLIVLAAYAIVCGFLGVLPYSGLQMIASVILWLLVCYVANWLLAKVFNAQTNVESWAITALILFFLFMPLTLQPESVLSEVWIPILAGVIAMASKYIFVIKRQHIFNPAAYAAVVLSFSPSTVALWWIGSPVMLPITLIVGFLIVRKIRKFSMFFSFVAASLVGTFILGIQTQNLSTDLFVQMILSGPLIFLGTIMLTEPLTTPPRRKLQMIYGALVGILSTLQFNIGPLYSTPELALFIGNIFSYIVGPKQKLFLYLKEKSEIAENTHEFIFESQKLKAKAGQYLEWTLPHPSPDSRGVRRFFTIASSPTEGEVRLGVKIGKNVSSFKKQLLSLEKNAPAIATSLAGDFVLPDDHRKTLVFIAGGIGITPFRSMVKYLLDKQEKRTITLLYFNKNVSEIAYKEIFDQAGDKMDMKTVYILTDRERIPSGWKGEVGRLDAQMLSRAVPDAATRIFYLSGPNALVNNYKRILLATKISRKNIVTDYFPGF